MYTLLSRDAFREAVFARDKHTCILCGAPGQDAHHIIERRLWPDGGYYLANGATVCGPCHIACEQTLISPDTLWDKIKVSERFLPPHLYTDQEYDKWGNPVLTNRTRTRGELFNDPSVQKVLKEGGVLSLFTHYVKYPRTYHLPWSKGVNDDDRIMESRSGFEGRRVIVTEKMDGENTSMYSDYFHARSVDGRNHSSRAWAKQLWGRIMGDIPDDWRVCGENLYAQHSLTYNNLPSYFLGFSIWDESNVCLDWDDTQSWFLLLGITSVPVLYDGIYDEALLRKLADTLDPGVSEGYVVRVADRIPYSQFRHTVGKYVRANHVQTAKHWMHGQRVVPNQLAAKV